MGIAKMMNENAAMLDVVSRYCDDISVQISDLISEINAGLSAGDASSFGALERLHNELHRMSGTAYCMGFRALGREFEALDAEVLCGLNDPDGDVGAYLKGALPKLSTIAMNGSDVRPRNSKLLQRSRALDELVEAETHLEAYTDQKNAQSRMLARERFLFADDDPHLRELIGSSLREMGVEDLLLAESGSEVLEAIETFKPTFIITDWMMQPVSGLSLLKQIRRGKTELDPETPIVFFTSMRSRQDMMEANRFGVNKLIRKPVLPDAIIGVLLGILEKKYQINKRLGALS